MALRDRNCGAELVEFDKISGRLCFFSIITFQIGVWERIDKISEISCFSGFLCLQEPLRTRSELRSGV
jgi:hypothetical protein